MYQKIGLNNLVIPKNNAKIRLSFPLDYDEDLSFLAECIRVEGSLNKGTKNMSFGNSDISLLKEVERILAKFNCHIYKTLHISVKIPDNLTKEDIQIIDLSTNKIKEKFLIRHSERFDREFHELTFLETKIVYGSEKRYKIYLKGIPVEVHITIPETSRIMVHPRGEVTAVVQLIFANFALREVFRRILEIPEGRKSRIIYVPIILQNSSKSVIASAISAVLACEGFITYLEPPKSIRTVSVEMTSERYVQGLKELFDKLGITSYLRIRKNRNIFSLHVYGKENLLKMQETIKFIEPFKKNRFDCMLNTYRNFNDAAKAEELVTQAIKRLGKDASIANMAKFVGREERTIKTYLGRLIKENKIISSKTRPSFYKLSNEV